MASMPEVESFSGDFILFAPLGTAVSLWLLGAGRRKPWPLVIEFQQPDICFDVPTVTMRDIGVKKYCAIGPKYSD